MADADTFERPQPADGEYTTSIPESTRTTGDTECLYGA